MDRRSDYLRWTDKILCWCPDGANWLFPDHPITNRGACVSRLFRPKRQGCKETRAARARPREDGQRPKSLMLTDSLLEQNGMRSAGPARAATIALGIASAFENIERRNAARETWMRLQSVGRTLHVRFVLRVPTVGGTSALRTARLERNMHKDVLIVRVSPGVIDALRGRVLTLHLGFNAQLCCFGGAHGSVQADDDAYIVVPPCAQQLGLMSRALSPHNRSIIHGWLGWSGPIFLYARDCLFVRWRFLQDGEGRVDVW